MTNQQRELLRARTALSGGDPESAARILQNVLADNPRDIDARYLHGRCAAALGRWHVAAAEFRRVLSARSGFFPAMVDLGIAETFDGNFQEARAVLEQARAIDAHPAELHFGLGLCRLESGEYSGAVQAFRDAIDRNPQFPDAHNNLGVAYDRLGSLPDAIECFRQAAALHPSYADAHRNLGDALLRSGEASAAAAAYQRAADLNPADGTARAELGAAQLAAGDLAAAVPSLEQALNLDTRLAGAAANLGEALRRLNATDRAAKAFQRALNIDSQLAEAHLGVGRLAAARGDAGSAARSLIAATGGKRADAKLAITVAAELEDLGFASDALAVLRACAGAQPRNADVHDALGAVLHRSGRLPEALDCYERALDIDDRRARTHINCGRALESMGALGRALACFERALTLSPADAQSVASIASCAFRLCDWDLAQRMLSTLRQSPHGIDELAPFLLLASDLTPDEIANSLRRRARARDWPDAPPLPLARLEASRDRLRIAYVSPDFRAHPVAYAIAGVIERHDRARIAPIAISLSAADGSAIGSRLQGAFEEFIDASTLADRDVVKLMRARAIDIAIDIAGLTAGARTAIFAMRAAPAQVNFLGFPGSMGMGFMDFIVADRIVLPESDEKYYSEEVLRMPACYLPFDDGRIVAADNAGRETAGLPTDGFVYCAFTNGYKITREIYEVWMSLLREVPDSVLWLRSMGAETAANLKGAAVKLGVAANRLVFAPFVEPIDAHLSRLQLADLFLDTLPYNAHTTAAEALWAGVPVITCRGDAFAGRVGASLLTACGLPELICSDVESYRALALEIARSPALHTKLREQLRQHKPSAPLFATGRYARDFEDLLFEIGRRSTQRAVHSVGASGPMSGASM
jgi:predicted O-linked N-acetylglucosamine transferase (SPINDLY family)